MEFFFPILNHSSAVAIEEAFHLVWNEKFVRFIYTQKIFKLFLPFFFSRPNFCAVLVSDHLSYAIRMLWMIWNTAGGMKKREGG